MIRADGAGRRNGAGPDWEDVQKGLRSKKAVQAGARGPIRHSVGAGVRRWWMLLSPHVDEVLLVHQVPKLLSTDVARVVLRHGTSRRVPAVMLLEDGVKISGDKEGTVITGKERR